MSSLTPSPSSGTPKPADLFEGLWRQLGECHQSSLQELEAKVSKLKKERCLDAQRLEVFYNRQQQLKEQNKTLQDTISLLEERLHTGECDQCAVLKNNLEQKLHLIAQLTDERNTLKDENRKLHVELQILKTTQAQQDSSSEQEEGVIPDSPVLHSSLPVANKLKKRKNIDKMKRVRYAEVSPIQPSESFFNDLHEEPVGATKSRGRAEVLVPNTCEMETSQYLSIDKEEVVAETCALDLFDRPPMKHEAPAGQNSTSVLPWKNTFLKSSTSLSTRGHSPDSTAERSPSLLPCVSHLSDNDSINKAKRKKVEIERDNQLEDIQGNQEGVDKPMEGKRTKPGLTEHTSAPFNNQSLQRQTSDCTVQQRENGTLIQRSSTSCASPVFKKPNVRETNKNIAAKRRNPLQDLTASCQHNEEENLLHHLPTENRHNVEPSWSMDPALALSMYDSELTGDEEEEEECHGDMQDTDCTWVSHSLLQRHGDKVRDKGESAGLGERANDSLDMMFDTSAYGEYKSCNSPHMGQSQHDEEDEDDDEDMEDDEDPHEKVLSQTEGHKAGRPAFAHVAVVRKKDERRKLKGTTCKECEIYYAHLPEEEKQKKLSSCSRHRFLYIPPSTPEHFWEVGFPSTQTCIDRGYIREEKNPQARPRRRRPLNALFTPKKGQQES